MMLTNKQEIVLSFGIFVLALLLLMVIIPQAVVAPNSVSHAVLAPSFWPKVIAWIMCVIGGMMILKSLFGAGIVAQESQGDADESASPGLMMTVLRLLFFIGLMVAYYLMIPTIGLPAASVVVFSFFSLFLCRTEYKTASILVSIILPLVLYAFFYHIAGVDIPQGEYWRLP